MDSTAFDLRIFSPRWGTEDAYEIQLSRELLLITHGPRQAKCEWKETLDPQWAGDDLIDALENDAIYPPSVLPRMFEHAWRAWRGSELDDQAVQRELEEVATWLNQISGAKPRTEFWKSYF